MPEDVKRSRDATHDVDPSVKVMMWADMLTPSYPFSAHYTHGGHVLVNPGDFDLVPRDVIQCIWAYNREDVPTMGWDSIEFFAKHGFQVTGSPWYDRREAENWGRIARRASDACPSLA